MKMLDRYSPEFFQQIRERSPESGGDLAEGAQSRLAGSAFQVGDVDLMDA